MKKNILIYYERDCSRAPRVLKQVSVLKNEYNIHIATKKFQPTSDYGNSIMVTQLPEENNVVTWHLDYPVILRKLISFILKMKTILESVFNGEFWQKKYLKGFWNRKYKRYYNLLKSKDFSLVIAHHPSSLALCYKLSQEKKIPLVFNAHEYYPLEFENQPDWIKNSKPSVDFMCKTYLPKVDDIFSVGNTIGNKFISDFGAKGYSFVPNDKPYHKLDPVKPSSKIRLIHHGGAIRGRHLENLIQVMDFLPVNEYELTFMLIPTNDKYMNELREMTAAYSNINFMDSVSFSEIIPAINQFDIGVYVLPPNCYNNEYALPNKFYEFIQARLCLCISPNPEMKRLIDKFDLGRTSKDYSAESMAQTILALSKEDILYHKDQCHKHAQELSSEQTEETIRTVIKDLIV